MREFGPKLLLFSRYSRIVSAGESWQTSCSPSVAAEREGNRSLNLLTKKETNLSFVVEKRSFYFRILRVSYLSVDAMMLNHFLRKGVSTLLLFFRVNVMVVRRT